MRVFFLFILFVFSFLSKAQKAYSFPDDIKFVKYLHDNKEFSDALVVLHKQEQSSAAFSATRKDSLNYFFGWSHYNKKNLDSASIFFSRVRPPSTFYSKSKFYESFCTAYSGKYSKPDSILGTFQADSATEQKLKNFECAGISLLTRDYARFDTLSKQFKGDYFPVQSEEKDLIQQREKLSKMKKKSPFLAGTMSVVIPGTGKLYAGYKGQAIAAFLQVVSLAAVAGEAYARDGIKSPQFIVFGGLFSIFYVGNIWGSAASVRVKRKEANQEIDNEILFDLHIPLRRIFN